MVLEVMRKPRLVLSFSGRALQTEGEFRVCVAATDWSKYLSHIVKIHLMVYMECVSVKLSQLQPNLGYAVLQYITLSPLPPSPPILPPA